MGETLPLFEPTFNRSVKVESRPERLSSAAGGILLREALERLHVVEDLAVKLEDPRDPTCIEHSLEELLRTMLIAQALGWEDQSDVDALRDDPVLAIARSDRRGGAAAGKALFGLAFFWPFTMEYDRLQIRTSARHIRRTPSFVSGLYSPNRASTTYGRNPPLAYQLDEIRRAVGLSRPSNCETDLIN